jgi:hypothetical protein
MKKFYQCEICDTLYASEEKALACEALGFNPLYEIDDKVMYEGAVVIITHRSICELTHAFIYRFSMNAEDNPGKILSSCGWQNEEKLSPQHNLQGCA